MLARLRAFVLGGLAAGLAASPALANDEPLARFEDPLCPGVAGLKVEAAQMVVGRIRENAEMFGLQLADEAGCEPNLIVAFVEDGQQFLQRLDANKPMAFADMAPKERRDLLADTGPVHVLHTTMVRSRDGMPVPRRENLQDIPQAKMWGAHSRIYTPTRRDIVSVLVLFDGGAVANLDMIQLADYATLRALAKTPPASAGADNTILSLFQEGEDRPQEMSVADRAFLGELYAGIPNLPGTARRAELEQAVRNAAE